MKYLNIILIVLIVSGIGVGTYFFFFSSKTPAPAETQATDSPETAGITNDTKPADFAVSFYQWYLTSLEKDPEFAFHFAVNTSASEWFTPEFIITNSAGRSEVDPVYLSQDYDSSWATHIKTNVTRESGTESVVLVTLGDKNSETLSVRLLKSDNSWRVASITKQ